MAPAPSRERLEIGLAAGPAAFVLGVLLALAAPDRADAVVITEIMYHPSAADEAAIGPGANLEWIEIYNEDPGVRHLSGYRINGVEFTFPPDTWLEGKKYLVVCAQQSSVRTHYGITNTIGDFSGRLDNDGETIDLLIFGGGSEFAFRYKDRDLWPHAADGTGHSLMLVDPYEDPDDPRNWVASPGMGGTPGGPNFDEPTIIETEIFGDGETWRYLKGTAPYPAGWNDVGFDDSAWSSGRTGIGYGDGDDRTVLNDMSGNYWSFAARFVLQLTQNELDDFDDVTLFVDYDDGFVCWINGQEVARGAMTGAPGSPVAHNAAAELHEADGFESFPIPRAVFRSGDNVIACQVNNNTLGSSDASFIPRLSSVRTIRPTPSGEPVPVVINEVQFRDPAGAWIELFNTSSRSIDLSGFYLSDTRDELGKYALPAASVVASRGFLAVTEEQSSLAFAGPVLMYYLSRPDLSEVVAAGLFENADDLLLDGFSAARLPDGGERFFESSTPTAGAANAVALERDLVISEILYHPPPTRVDLEFVEVANRGAAPLDLTGFRFTQGIDFAFPDGFVLAPGAYAVIAQNPAAVEDAHGITGVLGPYAGQLADSGERLRIDDPFGNIADEVRYQDGGRWPELADGGGSSLELLDLEQDNSVASAWEASDESTKSTWEEFEFTVSLGAQAESEFQIRMLSDGECLIDAIEVRNASGQYIVNGSFESNTSPWRIEGNHIQSVRTTEDSYAGNACLKIVATGDGDLRVNRIEQDTQPAMTGGSYTVKLALRWLRGGNIIHFSGYRQPSGFQVTQWMTYPVNLGSPGRPNSVAVANLGPVISEVMHSPAVPAPLQGAQVRAVVSDFDGVASVVARYRTGTLTGSYSSAELFDDGAHQDGRAGDGVYGGTVPGQNSNVKIVYHIEARDNAGNVRRYPRSAPARGLVYIHDSPFTARGHALRLIQDDTNWSVLNSRQLHSNELLDATFVFNDEKAYYNVGTRFRGSPWNRPPSPRMYRIRFNKDDLYRGRRAINISRYGNNQRERAAYYAIWRNSTDTATAPMSLSNFARFRSNSGTATMEQVDPVNGDYLRRWFPGDDDGALYKILGKQLFDDNGNHQGSAIEWATFQYRGTQASSYRWFFSARTKEIRDDSSDLSTWLQKMSGSTTVLDNELDEYMDVEQFWRVYAARCAHDDWDTISIRNGQNAYVYYAPIEGRFKLLPWDMDHSWGSANARVYPDADSRMAAVLNRPKYRRAYIAVLDEMLNGRGGEPGHWTVGEMVRKYLDRNTAAVGADGVANGSEVENFINNRTARLRAEIPSAVPFGITTNNGLDMTVNSANVTIEGNAWIDVHQIIVNDEPAELTWVTTSRWRTNVGLGVGENELSFLAFDVDARFLASDDIKVTSTVGWDPPSIANVDPLVVAPGDEVSVLGTEFHDAIRVFFDGVPATDVRFAEAVDPTRLVAVVPIVPPGVVAVTVQNVDTRTSLPAMVTVLPLPPMFVRGEVNFDGTIDLSDALSILLHLFAALEIDCPDAADFDDNEALELTDAIAAMNYLFRNGPAPAAPFPRKGWDATGTALDCPVGLSPYD